MSQVACETFPICFGLFCVLALCFWRCVSDIGVGRFTCWGFVHVGISAFGLLPLVFWRRPLTMVFWCLSSCVALCVCRWVFSVGFQCWVAAFLVGFLAGVSAHVQTTFARSWASLTIS